MNKIYLLLVLMILSASMVFAQNEMHLSIQVKNSTGYVYPGAYRFEINLSTWANCTGAYIAQNVALASVVRDGYYSHYYQGINKTIFNQPTYACLKRNGTDDLANVWQIFNITTALRVSASLNYNDNWLILSNQSLEIENSTHKLVQFNYSNNKYSFSGNVTTTMWYNGLYDWTVNPDNSAYYLLFNGSHIRFNETSLNATIDAREINVSYDAGNMIYRQGYTLNVNGTELNTTITSRINESSLNGSKFYDIGWNNIIDKTSISFNNIWVNKTGDIITGDLNITSNLYIYGNITAYSSNISADWFLGKISWANVQDKAANTFDNVWLNLTGGTLTGGLTIGKQGSPADLIIYNSTGIKMFEMNTTTGTLSISNPNSTSFGLIITPSNSSQSAIIVSNQAPWLARYDGNSFTTTTHWVNSTQWTGSPFRSDISSSIYSYGVGSGKILMGYTSTIYDNETDSSGAFIGGFYSNSITRKGNSLIPAFSHGTGYNYSLSSTDSNTIIQPITTQPNIGFDLKLLGGDAVEGAPGTYNGGNVILRPGLGKETEGNGTILMYDRGNNLLVNISQTKMDFYKNINNTGTIEATGFVGSGKPGLSVNLNVSNSCNMTITNGLITSFTGCATYP